MCNVKAGAAGVTQRETANLLHILSAKSFI